MLRAPLSPKVLLIACALLGGSILAGAVRADGLASIAGTWELNAAQSKFTPGTQIKAQTRTFEVHGNVVKQTIDSIDLDGKEVHSQSVAHYDGKDYPLEHNPEADTISVAKTSDLTAKATLKKGGKVVQTVERTLSADGRTCTFHYQGSTASGEMVDNTLVFDRK